VQRQGRIATSSTIAVVVIPTFRGLNVRNIGLRYRTGRNSGQEKRNPKTDIAWNRFFLAISYIKVYRSQPEPEFMYLSDARIPPVVTDNMVHHDRRELVTTSGGSSWGAVPILIFVILTTSIHGYRRCKDLLLEQNLLVILPLLTFLSADSRRTMLTKTGSAFEDHTSTVFPPGDKATTDDHSTMDVRGSYDIGRTTTCMGFTLKTRRGRDGKEYQIVVLKNRVYIDGHFFTNRIFMYVVFSFRFTLIVFFHYSLQHLVAE
jgi:hypothetical protein